MSISDIYIRVSHYLKLPPCHLLKCFSEHSSAATSPGQFLVTFQTMSNTDHGHVRRRQNTAGNYIDGNGAATASCLASPTYFINNLGQLSTPDGRVISASKDAGFSRFVPSTTVSDISTTWKLSGSTLSFHNGTFLNGIATLCLNIVSDQVEMYYFAVPRPTCSMIALTIAPCQYYVPSGVIICCLILRQYQLAPGLTSCPVILYYLFPPFPLILLFSRLQHRFQTLAH